MQTSMLKPDLDERRFGSSFDPLLDGVAQGLARLFPPIENVRRGDHRDDSDGPRAAASEEDGADE